MTETGTIRVTIRKGETLLTVPIRVKVEKDSNQEIQELILEGLKIEDGLEIVVPMTSETLEMVIRPVAVPSPTVTIPWGKRLGT